MSKEKELTVEEVDAHIAAHEGKQKTVDTSKMSDAQLKAFNLCDVINKVRPILKFVRGLLFWKHKWQLVIDELLAVADQACPVA